MSISPKALNREGWECIYRGLGKHQRWSHRDGWLLEHCGHATARTPWMLYTPEGRRILTGARAEPPNPNFGTAWPTLADAVQFVALKGAAFLQQN